MLNFVFFKSNSGMSQSFGTVYLSICVSVISFLVFTQSVAVMLVSFLQCLYHHFMSPLVIFCLGFHVFKVCCNYICVFIINIGMCPTSFSFPFSHVLSVFSNL